MLFPIVLRGYARPQVDAHLATLVAQLQQAVQRAELATAERDQARAERDRVRDALTEAEREALLRAEEAELALVALHEASATPEQPEGTRPIPLGTQLLRDETTVVATLAPTGAEHAPEVLPGPRAPAGPRRRSRAPLAVGAALALLGVGTAAVLLSRDGEPAATAVTAPPSATPSPLSGGTAPQAARAVPAEPAQVPAGWSTHRSDDGLWSIGLPPGWRVSGDEFVSASGLTSMSVRTGDVSTQADLLEYEKAFAAQHPGYQRLSAKQLDLRGHPAGTWDYTYGSGELEQRGSDLVVLAGERGYWLHVVSRASAWEFAEPLVEGFRSSFTPTP